MCTQIERGKKKTKQNKVQWNKWHEKSCKLNRSCVHHVYKVTTKQKFFYSYTNFTFQLLGHINVLNPRGIGFKRYRV
jgi:hypothetical protein